MRLIFFDDMCILFDCYINTDFFHFTPNILKKINLSDCFETFSVNAQILDGYFYRVLNSLE